MHYRDSNEYRDLERSYLSINQKNIDNGYPMSGGNYIVRLANEKYLAHWEEQIITAFEKDNADTLTSEEKKEHARIISELQAIQRISEKEMSAESAKIREEEQKQARIKVIERHKEDINITYFVPSSVLLTIFLGLAVIAIGVGIVFPPASLVGILVLSAIAVGAVISAAGGIALGAVGVTKLSDYPEEEVFVKKQEEKAVVSSKDELATCLSPDKATPLRGPNSLTK